MNLAQNVCLDDFKVMYIFLSSDFLKFFCLVQFLSNYWSYRVVFGTCEVFVFLSNYCAYSQWYLVHAYILAWPLECSHPYLTLTFISQSIRHATLSYLLILSFWLWSECYPWSVLDQILKVLCCSGERYRAIMALLFFFSTEDHIFSHLYMYIVPSGTHWNVSDQTV